MLLKLTILILALSYLPSFEAQLSSTCLTSIQQGVQETINKQRVCNGNCVALTVQSELTTLAQTWANYLGTVVKAMQHNPNRTTTNVCRYPPSTVDNYCGENIYQSMSSVTFPTDTTSCYSKLFH